MLEPHTEVPAVLRDPLLRADLAAPPRTLVDILTSTALAHPDAPAIDDGTVVLS
jgi:hypothetical protein